MSSGRNYNAADGSGSSQPPNKAKHVQQQVDEVVGIMQDNINKVMERGEKLDALQTKTGFLITSM